MGDHFAEGCSMAKRDKRYQRYLARKRRKQEARSTRPKKLVAWTSQTEGGLADALQIAAAARFPVHQALVPAELAERGIGNLVFSRLLPDGRVAMSAFLLDVFCLGVKNAFAAILTRDQHLQRLNSWVQDETLQPMEPACFRKLVEGAVAYARGLGFSPHSDYAVASQIFGGVESETCAADFKYGRDGKPFNVSGPNETPAQVQAIMDELERRAGAGNFDYLVMVE